MYSSKEIKDKYGIDPSQTDLSRMNSWEDFIAAMNYCCMKQFTSLEKGGRMAILMGDMKKKGKLYSMLCDIVKPGTIENIVIKTQHNCVSDRNTYYGSFIKTVHEYVLILRKDNDLYYTMKCTYDTENDIRDMMAATWKDVVADCLSSYKGQASLSQLYLMIASHKKALNNENYKAKVRQTLQRYPNVFRHTDKGVWALA